MNPNPGTLTQEPCPTCCDISISAPILSPSPEWLSSSMPIVRAPGPPLCKRTDLRAAASCAPPPPPATAPDIEPEVRFWPLLLPLPRGGVCPSAMDPRPCSPSCKSCFNVLLSSWLVAFVTGHRSSVSPSSVHAWDMTFGILALVVFVHKWSAS